MPDGLLNGLDDQALRDLFAYLRIPQPIRGKYTARTTPWQ